MTATKLWYPHYIRDFKAKTGHLSLAERGAYRALMDEYWERQGPLPASDRALCRMIGAFPDEWEDVRENVLAFFDERDGKLHHFRIDEEIEKAQKQHREKTERMAKARAKRWEEKKQSTDQSIDQSTEQNTDQSIDQISDQKPDQKPDQITSTPTPSPTPSPVSYETQEPTNARKRASPDEKNHVQDQFEESFWPHYPRRAQESGALTRGSKHRALRQWERLRPQERQAALNGLKPYKRLNPDRSRGVVDAERYLRDKRWEDVADAEQSADRQSSFDPLLSQFGG